MMDDKKLENDLGLYASFHTPEVSRQLMDRIIAVPEQMDKTIRQWVFFILPRAALVLSCMLGLLIGGLGDVFFIEEDEISLNSEYYPYEYEETLLNEGMQT